MPSVQERAFTLDAPRGGVIDGDVRFPAEAGALLPVVVMCHGFKGFKDWGPFPAWGRRLAEGGFCSVLFNFSYNGVAADAPTAFTELEKFAENTFTRELSDLGAVLDAVEKSALPEAPLDPACLGLLGHSRGGGTAVLQAAEDARVRALATWSAVSGFIERFTPEQMDDWKRQGYTEILNSRTGQRMRLGRVLYDDALAHRERLDIQAAAARVSVPWLIVHAPDDEAVPMAEAKALESAAEGALFVAEGGHTFGGAHPFDGEVPPSLEAVWARTTDFFKRTLAPE